VVDDGTSGTVDGDGAPGTVDGIEDEEDDGASIMVLRHWLESELRGQRERSREFSDQLMAGLCFLSQGVPRMTV
jgi:hypothetical protein